MGGGGVGELVPEECAPHSRRRGGATRPVEMAAQPWVVQRKGKWASQAFRGYERSYHGISSLGAQGSSREERSA